MDQNEKIKENITDNPYRQFSTYDIKNFRKNLGTVIIAPYNERQVNGVGYNLTASNMVFSLSKHKLLTIYDYKDGRYFKLKAHDTALVLSHEYFLLDSNVAGNFYSRVRRVSEGLGHISTTLDPNWKGMFLIAINNTTNRTLKVQISSIFEGKEEKNGIATVVLTGINPGDKNKSNQIDSLNLDNPAMRIDILKELAREPSHIRHSVGYKRFKKLVNELDSFEPKETEISHDVNKIKEILIEIRNALMYEEKMDKAKASISSLDWFSFDKNEELKNKINGLKKYLDHDNHYLYVHRTEVDNQISLLKKECDYILLCENVSQIHDLINNHIQYHHKFGKIKRIVLKAIENITFIFVLLIMILLSVFLIQILTTKMTTAEVEAEKTKLYFSIALALISAFINLVVKKIIGNDAKKSNN